MLPGFPIDHKKLRAYNTQLYKGIPPTWELIEEAVKKSKLKRLAVFERIHQIPQRTLTRYKNGHFMLPAIYWHIFYEYEAINQIYKKPKKNNKFTPKSVSNFVSNHAKILANYGSK